MTRALVTGAGGFVGRFLCAHLRAEGDEVIGTDRTVDDVDITDFEAVSALMARAEPDVIYHLAGFSDVGDSWSRPEAAMVTNVIGTQAVLRAAAARAGATKVLTVTSADVYGSVGPDHQPIDETAPLRPESPYAASKAAAEMVAIQAGLGLGLHVVRARAFNHAGPGQRTGFVIPALVDRVLAATAEATSTVAVGDLSPTRDFTDVRDVVRAYRLLMQQGTSGEAYNVCSGSEISIGEVLDLVIAACGADITPVVDPLLLRPVDVPRRVGDNTKLCKATGWRPSFSLAETLDAVVDERRGHHPSSEIPSHGEH